MAIRSMRIPIERPLIDRWWHSAVLATFDRVVTPAEALQLLEHAGDVNRGVAQWWVNALANHLRAGTFLPAAQQADCVTFDINGKNSNGQHRLWAIVESGIPAELTIKVGLDPQSIEHLDNHLRRSHAVQYGLARGEHVTAATVAVVKRLLGTARRPLGGWDRAALFAGIEKHRELIDVAFSILPQRNKRVKGLGSAPVATVIARAARTVPLERLARFVEILESGVPTEIAGEATVILLRDWMQRNGAGSGPMQNELYWKTERALAAFLNHEQLTILYSASSELFPLADEPPTRASVLAPAQIRRRVHK